METQFKISKSELTKNDIQEMIEIEKDCEWNDIKDLKCVNGLWSFILGKGVFSVELTKSKRKIKDIKYLWAAKTGLWD